MCADLELEAHCFVSGARTILATPAKILKLKPSTPPHVGTLKNCNTSLAMYFVDTVGALSDGEVMVLDIEVASSNASLHSAQDVASWSKDFVDAVCALAKVPPSRVLIYTGAWFW